MISNNICYTDPISHKRSMLLSYTISSNLRKTLSVIEPIRRSIILTPLSPQAELKLHWEATVERTYATARLTEIPMQKTELTSILQKTETKTKQAWAQEVVDIKRVMDTLRWEWTANETPLTVNTLINLWLQLYDHRLSKPTSQTIESMKPGIKHVLDYIQAKQGETIVDAAIAHIELLSFSKLPNDYGRLARVASYLFLYKNGYDFRKLLVLETWLLEDKKTYESIAQESLKLGNVTTWLEYFAQLILKAAESIQYRITTTKIQSKTGAHIWELTDRQREILTILEAPDNTQTNKKVQKRFAVSQITASRDLAKLATLGLIYPHGKGRSIYYTKI